MKDYRSVGIKAASFHASYEFYFGTRGRQAAPSPKQETKPMQPTAFRAFHNALRILRSLDWHEVSFLSEEEWKSFRDSPYMFFIETSDSNASLIWQAVQRRQPAELAAFSKNLDNINTLLLDATTILENWERDGNIPDPTGAVRGQRKALARELKKAATNV